MWYNFRDRTLFGVKKNALTRSATLVISAITSLLLVRFLTRIQLEEIGTIYKISLCPRMT